MTTTPVHPWTKRANSHSAGTKGSAVSTPAKKKVTPTTTSAHETLVESEESTSRSNKGHRTNTPTPMYKPYVTPGHKGVPGKTLYVGFMSPDLTVNPNNKYRFIFHWNPPEIDIDTSTSYQAGAAPQVKYTGNARNIYAATTSMSFQFMINRQDEVAAANHGYAAGNLGWPIEMKYGSNNFNGRKARTFGEVGTLYDLEFLYLTINGEAGTSSLGPKNAPAISAPYILASPLYITFGKSQQFYGYCTDLSINHMMFTAAMVPTITYVQLTFNALALQNIYADEFLTSAQQAKYYKHLTKVTNPQTSKIAKILDDSP